MKLHLTLTLIAFTGCAGTPDDGDLSSTDQDVTVGDVMSRAQNWVDLQVPYCGGVNGGTDYLCGGTCQRPHAAWDNFRSDCSGFVSWAWQIMDDPTSDVFTQDRGGTDGWSTISIDSLAQGDALTTNGHIKLFSRFVSASSAEILEEFDCGEVAHRTVQSFTRSGNTIYFAHDSRPYHPIRRHSLTQSPPTEDRVAFQANTNDLWTQGGDALLGMMAGTSPSIVALAGGGYEIAFQANTGVLWTTGTAGTRNWGLGMMAGTNPGIAALADGGYEVAFQANTSSLWTAGTADIRDWHLGLRAGTSPSIAGLSGGGYQFAFQANTGTLWTGGAAGIWDWQLGMEDRTNPSITALPGNGWEVAFQANSTSLWTAGTAGLRDWHLGLDPASSPSIAAVGDGFTVAFQANTNTLWFAGTSAGIHSTNLGMKAGTSPGISHVHPDRAYFQANTGTLWSSATGSLSLGMENPTSPSGT